MKQPMNTACNYLTINYHIMKKSKQMLKINYNFYLDCYKNNRLFDLILNEFESLLICYFCSHDYICHFSVVHKFVIEPLFIIHFIITIIIDFYFQQSSTDKFKYK